MSIVYTSGSWNYQLGCSPLLSGCAHCYAARDAAGRLSHLPDYAGLTESGQWTGELRVRGNKKWSEPLRKRKPQTLFVNSTSDTFHGGALGDDRIARAWATMILAFWHRFLVCTKRPAQAAATLSDPDFYGRVLHWADVIRAELPPKHPCQNVGVSSPSVKPPRNVWIGASASTDKELRETCYKLQDVPAQVRWLSLEPLLERVNLVSAARATRVVDIPPFDWVVCGGESGPKARVFDLDWGRDLRMQCQQLRIPLYIKQVGAHAVHQKERLVTRHRKGEDPSEWPPFLQCRESPEYANIVHGGARKLIYTNELFS